MVFLTIYNNPPPIAGQDPTVHPEEWLGALVALLPKSLAALLMTEFRPVGKPCAKFVIFSKAIAMHTCNCLADCLVSF
jgi:hypothetical protein